MAEEIKINIGADSSKLQAELQKAENELKQFQAALKKTTDVAEIQKLQTNVKGLETQISSLRGGMQKLTPASNTATQSLTNLSRIAQDAPFGFIGIANNINPLVESFGRLRQETGSTGGALKALVSGLGGAGGLSLAFGLVTSAVQFAAIGFQAWLGKTKEAKEAADETKKALNSIYNEQAKEATQVVSFIAILNNETETRNRKLDALNELKKINPQIFAGLKLEEGAVKGLDAAYSAYIANLKNVIAAKIIQQRLEKEITKLVELEGATQTKSEKQRAENIKNFAKLRANDLKKLGAEGANFANQIEDQNKALIAQQDAAKKTQIALTSITIAELTEDLTALSNTIKTSGKSLSDETKNAANNSKKDIETIQSVLEGLEKSLIDAFSVGVALETPRPDVVKQKIGLVEGAIKKLIADFNLSPDNEIIVRLRTQLNTLEAQLNAAKPIIQKTTKNLADELAKNPAFTLQLKPKIELPEINAEDIDGLVDLSKSVESYFQKSFSDLGVLIGDTIAGAITGTASLSDFYGGIFKIIGTGLQELGKQFIAVAAAMLIVKQSLFANPAAAAVAGIALVALGGVITQLANKKQAFAVGTRNAPGGMALIGERGPELVNLPGGSQVVPAAQTSAMMGGVGGSIEVFGMLRGQDIYFSNKKYGQTYGRTT
jgi:hypothetical protein